MTDIALVSAAGAVFTAVVLALLPRLLRRYRRWRRYRARWKDEQRHQGTS